MFFTKRASCAVAVRACDPSSDALLCSERSTFHSASSIIFADLRYWNTACSNLPLGSVYSFSVLLRPLEQELGIPRSALSLVFGVATAGFTVGSVGAAFLYRAAPAPLQVLASAVTAAAVVANNPPGVIRPEPDCVGGAWQKSPVVCRLFSSSWLWCWEAARRSAC